MSRISSSLLLLCIISITLTCFVSFTQSEEYQSRHYYKSRAAPVVKSKPAAPLVGAESLTTGGSLPRSIYDSGNDLSYNSTSNSTTGASSSNSTSNSTGTTGSLTTGASTTGETIPTNPPTNAPTSAPTTGSTQAPTAPPAVVVVKITYKAEVDPTTINKTAIILQFAVVLGVPASQIDLQFESVTTRSIHAVGLYNMVFSVTTEPTSAFANLTSDSTALQSLANSTALTSALSTAGVAVKEITTTRTVVASPTSAPTSSSTSTTGNAQVGGTTGVAPAVTPEGLSGGAIAGIIIAVVAVVAIVVVAVVVSKKRGHKKHKIAKNQVQPLIEP